MIPSITDRMMSVIHSMEEIVLPAVSSDGLAKEQAGLVIGHLYCLSQQIENAFAFEKLELKASVKLAKKLVAAIAGGPVVQEASQKLAAAVAMSEVEPKLIEAVAATRNSNEALNAQIDRLVDASRVDGTQECKADITRIVALHGRVMSRFYRSWYASMRFEAGDVDLPAIDGMLIEFETYVGAKF